nr:telomere zinc finger-associated protein isoform X2 [Chrysemys picta bellii]
MDGSFVQHSVRVLQELNKQREKGQYCDATLDVGGLVFKAHWSVLACCSCFFQSLYGDGASSSIILPESFAEIFELLLDFFYTGHLALTSENREKVLVAAKELCVPEAVELCQGFKPKCCDGSDLNNHCLHEKGPREDLNGHLKQPTDSDGEEAIKAVSKPKVASEVSPSCCTRRAKLTQGPSGSPSLLRERLKRAVKTNALSNSGEVKNTQECKEIKRPPKRGGTEDRGISNEVVFTCSVCQEVFKRRMELRLHMVSHTGEMPYKCSSCVQQFMQKKDLQSHMIKLHGAPKPHACSACSKCFLSRTELRLHEAFKHRGEKLFVCEECGHRASSRNGLQMHIKAKHRNERPYVCEFCHHAFTQKANLNMHLRTHTGEKPFQCHLCGKTFRTQASLDKHNRTHTGERPFSCEFCDQRFTEKGPLLRHIASRHQEGRPHFCQICGKTFKAVEQLRVHVRRHKGVRKFECTECGYKFTRQAHLRRHMEIHDRVENYNPRQRKLRNLIIEDEKAVVVALQPPHELEVGPAEVIVESLSHSSLGEAIPVQRLCSNETFSMTDVIEQSLIITTAIPEDCET